jgi:4-amino-4-deoxy-L-arabinose transferase-like glycosyltransferase
VRDHAELGVIVVALVARLGYWALVTPRYVPDSDAQQYQEIAHNFATGRGFDMVFPQLALHPTAFRPPLYPLLLSVVDWSTGSSLVAGRALSLVLGLGVVLLTMRLAREIATRRAGLLAGLIVALYPPLLANDTVLLTESVSLLLMLALLLALHRRRVVGGAVLCGLLILARPSAQGVAVVVAAWVLWQVGWRRALSFVGIVGLVVAPWVVRNWVQLGSPVLVTSNGFNLAAMYSPAARARGAFVDPVFDPAFQSLRMAQFDEVGWQRDLQRLALASLRRHPSQVPRVVARNTTAMFELRPDLNRPAEIEDGRNLTFATWTLPLFYAVTIVGLIGVIRRWREPTVLLLMLIAAYFTATSLVLVAPPRLRAPFDLMCCIGCGLLADTYLTKRGKRLSRGRPTTTPSRTSVDR